MMARPLLWAAGLAGSLIFHAALLAMLWLAIRPHPVAEQPMPQTRIDVQAQRMDRVEARPEAPRPEAARQDAAEGTQVAAGSIRRTRAETQTPRPDRLHDAAPAPEAARPQPPRAQAAVPADSPVRPVAAAKPALQSAAGLRAEPVRVSAALARAQPAAAHPVPMPAVLKTAIARPEAASAAPPPSAPARPAAAALVPAVAIAPAIAAAANAPAKPAPAATARPIAEAAAALRPATAPSPTARPDTQIVASMAPPSVAAPPAAPDPAPAVPARPDPVAAANPAPDPDALAGAAPAPESAPPATPETANARLAEAATHPARPAAATGDRITAALAFSGADGEIDPVSLAAFQSFTRPGDAAAATDSLRDGVAGLLAQVPCSRLQVGFDPDTATLRVNGHIPETGLRGPVLAALRTQMGADIAVSDNILILPRPQCGALSGIADIGLPQSTDQITNPLLIGRETHARVFRFARGDLLSLDMTAPDYDAWIYLDYFDADGNVLHLEPNEHVPLRHARAAEIQQIGARTMQDSGLKLVVGPPYGQEIAVAFAASRPLYDGLRPLSEPAAPYLDWLKGQVAKARASDPDFKGEWVYFFVTTSAN